MKTVHDAKPRARGVAPRRGWLAAPCAAAVLALPGASASRLGGLRRSSASPGPLTYVGGKELPGDIVVSRLGNGTVHGRHLLTIQLGGKPFRVVADTGSFGLVMSSTRCPDWSCPVRSYNGNSSNTYEEESKFKVVKYVAGSVHLKAARDEMRLYDGPQKQEFWEITELGYQMKTMWAEASFDGILGLPHLSKVPGPDSANETTVTETFGVKSFTACLGRATIRPHFQGVDVTPSFLYWSPPGALKWAGTTYADVVSATHWAVSLGEVAAVHEEKGGPRSAHFACYGGLKCLALIDTGAKVLSLPFDAMFALKNQLPDGHVKPDCSNYDVLPDLTLTIGGVKLKMPREAYAKRMTFSTSVEKPEEVTHSCQLQAVQNDVGLEVSGEMVPMWILGVPFLQEYVAEFDRSSSPARVGLSPHPGRAGEYGECPETPPTGAGAVSAAILSAAAAQPRPQIVEIPDPEMPDALSLVGLGPSVVQRTPAESQADKTAHKL